ncbi:hypothetical protein Glove_707g55 [Diversispora epigaea]|uniref:Uncharacterized protein n=1 Tax=Diversispora epigaea TaxID=1348612 RepID=A0A397G4B6_9GLOM|nr:hypothetical protein Glove_707g55 [Diversispora epigaea]
MKAPKNNNLNNNRDDDNNNCNVVVIERKNPDNNNNYKNYSNGGKEPLTETNYRISKERSKFDEFLLGYPRGAYTVARTIKRKAIVELEGHVNRICNSLQQMKFTPSTENLTNGEHNDLNNNNNNNDNNNNRNKNKNKENNNINNNNNNNNKKDEKRKGEGEKGEDRGGEEKEAPNVTKELEPYRNFDKLKEMIIPLLKMGLKKYYEIEEETPYHIKGVDEANITLLVCYSFKESRPILAAQIRPLRVPSSPKCKVDVYGEPRKSARTKDSQWVRDRKVFEKSMHPGFNEVILTDPHTHNIYEGLSSNFFAVLHNPDTRQPLVVTAPLHCVLEGTIMKMVVMICNRDGIDFKFWFPNIEDISQWKGAFITSTSRLVLPIEIMRFRDGRLMEKLPTGDETIIHIKNEVEKEILNRAFRIL